MAMFRKAMLYLGLGPDEEYEEYDPAHDDEGAQQAQQAPAARAARPNVTTSSPGQAAHVDEPSAIGTVRPVGAQRAETQRVDTQRDTQRSPSQRESRSDGPAPPVLRPRPQVVRPITVTPNAKPQIVVPTSFNQAQEVADKFRGNQPVIVNMQSADRDLARRLIDFASGLCYGLGGQMEKVANQVYLLTPTNVEVSAEDRRRLQERNYDH